MKYKLSLNKLFKRKSFDPTTFQTGINDEWDTATSVQDNVQNVTQSGTFKKENVPLSRQWEEARQRVALFEAALPNQNTGV